MASDRGSARIRRCRLLLKILLHFTCLPHWSDLSNVECQMLNVWPNLTHVFALSSRDVISVSAETVLDRKLPRYQEVVNRFKSHSICHSHRSQSPNKMWLTWVKYDVTAWRLEVDLEIEYDWRRRLKNMTGGGAYKSFSMISFTYGRGNQRPLKCILLSICHCCYS